MVLQILGNPLRIAHPNRGKNAHRRAWATPDDAPNTMALRLAKGCPRSTLWRCRGSHGPILRRYSALPPHRGWCESQRKWRTRTCGRSALRRGEGGELSVGQASCVEGGDTDAVVECITT